MKMIMNRDFAFFVIKRLKLFYVSTSFEQNIINIHPGIVVLFFNYRSYILETLHLNSTVHLRYCMLPTLLVNMTSFCLTRLATSPWDGESVLVLTCFCWAVKNGRILLKTILSIQ